MNIKEERIEDGEAMEKGEIDWSECPEAIELKKQMASLEEKISNFKKEIEEEGEDEEKSGTLEGGRWSRPVYTTDPNLPKGWTFFRNREGSMFYRDDQGKFLKNRRNVLTEMYSKEGYSPQEKKYIRDGLIEEGWSYHPDLPELWMFKMYTHKIEGVYTDVLYHLSPDGTIYRSKKKIQKEVQTLNLSKTDLQKILEFKSGEKGPTAVRTLEDPDDSWYYDPECVPEGWKMKRYTYNSGATHKQEEVYHYLTPDNTIVRGKKQVHDWMLKHSCYNSEDFGLFHFNKKERGQAGGLRAGRPTVINWTDWGPAKDLPAGWSVRYGTYKYQKKVQYKSPKEQIFLSKFKVLRFLKSGCKEVSPENSFKRKIVSRNSNGELRTVWDEWREDDIPCLPGWQFSIGRKENRRKIRYKSQCGRVFRSRGPLIRYLHEKGLKGKQQLITLKKLLKTNQSKQFEDLRTNDKFIKNFTPDWNYLLFLKIRYDNQVDIDELTDSKLPTGWLKKDIHGVEYFKDPTGKFVFNSRKLLVDHLRTTNYDLSDDDLVSIMEESDSESDLSDTESEDSESEEEEEQEEDIIRRKKASLYQIPPTAIKKDIKIESEFLLADNQQKNEFMSF